MADADKSGKDFNEKDLEDKIHFLNRIAELSPNILFVIDVEEKKLNFISNKVSKLLGLDAKYFLDKGSDIFSIIIHPEDYDRRMDNLERCRSLSGEDECEVEVRLRAGENTWEWYRIKEKIFGRKEDGEVSQVLGIAENIHQQKIGEEKLREEHRRLENAQKIGHIGSFERPLPGDIMYCSREFYRILGIDPRPEGLLLEEFFSFVHPGDKESLLNAVDKTHSSGQPFDTVTRIVRPDKTIRHIHRRAAIIKDEHGTPLRVYGTIQDITSRIKSEEERKRMENLIRSTETLAETGSYELDLDTNAVFFSDGLFRLFGEEPGSITPSLDWIDQNSHPDDVLLIKEIVNEAVKHRSTYTYTRRIFRKDGKHRVLEAHGRFSSDPSTKTDKVIGIVQDITERKQAEEELRRSETRSRNLLEVLQNAPDAYLVLTPEFNIELASDAYLEATSTRRDKIIGKYIFDVFPDNPSNKNATGVTNLFTSLNKVLYNKEKHRMPIQHYDVRGRDGAFIEKHWSPTNTPVINSRGEVEYIIHRVLDITDVMKEHTAVKGLVSETEMLKTSLEEVKIQAQQLKENRALLQSVFDASPNSIILYHTIYDHKGLPEDFEFMMVNAFNHQVLQVPEDILGKRLSKLFPNTIPTGVFDRFKNTMKTGEPADFEVWYEGQGLKHWFHFRAVKLNNLLLATAEDITERKRAEKELIELKEELTKKATDKYRKIITSMDEGYCLLEIIRDDHGTCIDYRYLETNPVFEDQTGLKNVLGKTINELVPGIEDYWKKTYGDVARTGESIRFEDYAEALGRWFDVNAFRIDAPNEEHVAVIFKDITDRKEAEERKNFLLNLNDAIRSIEEPAKIQRIAMSILGRHLEVNRAYYSEILEDEDTLAERTGYLDDIAPLHGNVKISDFSTPLQKQFLEGKTLVLKDLLSSFEENKGAIDRIGASGVRAIIAVPLVKNEKLVALVVVQQKTPRQWHSQEIALVEEVSDQIWVAIEKAQAEKALRESEQRFRNLVEASALAVWESGPDGNVVQDSPSWREFTGQTYEEFIGQGWFNAIHPEDRLNAKKKWKEALETTSKIDTEYRLLSASGNERWTNVMGTPIFDIEGKVTKWSGMNIDIHDRKEAEEALVQAKEEAEAASRAKEDFLSTMSHEIRTPLNAVIGLTNLLLEKAPREDQKEDLNSLSFSAKNLLALINDILDFSKLEAGKAELSVTDFDLPGLLVNLKQAHQPLAANKKTHLELHIDNKIPVRIATDQLKLSQILHNLVSNAVKFTSNGKVCISVNLEKKKKRNLWLNFRVEDTGIGISEEKLEHIFDKFTQAESSTVRQYGGTGLGLSITRLLLELMGSRIKVKSTPGEGSLFYFSLPVKEAKTESVAPTLTGKLQKTEELQNLKILLVEDVEINRKIIIQFLQNWWKVNPDEAKNGKEAIEMARTNQYDLILMDIRMPVMDGYQASHEIRKIPAYKDVPILALTADKNQELQQEEYITKFTGLLTKPFEPLELKKKILLHLPHSYFELEENYQTEQSPSDDMLILELKDDEELMPLVLVQLKEYKQVFIKGVNKKDLQLLKDLRHKSKVVFDLLGLKELSQHLENAISVIAEGAEKEKLKEISEQAKMRFDLIIERIGEELNESSFEISRYSRLAGKNKEILQKLVSNSLGTMKTYQEEFVAAAESHDLKKLSDLIHKNTTSIHYLQANRLKNKIEGFRSMLKGGEVTEKILQEKQNEVIIEFQIIISGLKQLAN
ncbi:PAS domain S-box protein [Salinimicrobium xinjiangense]|uniref:PAS domain S-box protein n=1 Tax=Salinimicrobium xinjiangense TaxID=438596 RepID=UPI00041B5349|nr:PAS domain S-box protein [Salinimicrobium xinjiangense]